MRIIYSLSKNTLIILAALCGALSLSAKAQNKGPSGMIDVFPDKIALHNGLVYVMISRADANIRSYVYKGVEMLTDGYYSMDGKEKLAHLKDCVFTIKSETEDIIDISLKSAWAPGIRQQAVDMDIHYVLQKGKPGLYSYAILTHPKDYPATTFGEWRMVWKMDQDRFERLLVDSLRNMELPTAADAASALPTSIGEVKKLTTGVMAGEYECKYAYSVEYHDVGTFGHTSKKDKIGAWMVLGGYDFFNDGPTQADLNAGIGINIVHFGRDHYAGSGTQIAAGEEWSKIYGPFLLYVNSGTTPEAMWADAKKQVVSEKAAWPYAWLKNTPDYPLAAQRSSAAGKFTVHDPYKPKVSGAYAWVGLCDPGVNWQKDSHTYQYWAKANAKGEFNIPNIRPGKYTLHAFVNGAINEYVKQDVTVNLGQVTQLGTLDWQIPRDNGKILWEIGVPDRKAAEYKFGDIYFKPFMWETYSRQLPNPIEYDADKGDWKDKLNYVQSNYYTPDGKFIAWPWNIHFKLDNIPETGFATLTFAFAAFNEAGLLVFVNDTGSPFAGVTPPAEFLGGNAMVREGNHAKYSTYALRIPVGKLKKGDNTITLLQSHIGGRAASIMYDYISFEMPQH